MKLLVSSQQKLVPFLQGALGSYSGKLIRKLLEANLCRVNGRVERFGSRVVQRGDAIELAPSWKSVLTPKLSTLKNSFPKGGDSLQPGRGKSLAADRLDSSAQSVMNGREYASSKLFNTLYEDEFLKVVAKPAGWVCTDREMLKAFGPGYHLVHRLDKDTTGLLILAKGGKARDRLMELFAKREVEKHYLALVDGSVKEENGVRKSLLGKKGAYQGQTIYGSSNQGLMAITGWRVIARGNKATLVECVPETGRTHQIRVHMAEMSHPILVDRQYAQSFRSPLFIPRTLLHAYRLRFTFDQKEIGLTAPIPSDFQEALVAVGVNVGHLGELLAEKKHPNRRDDRHDDKNAEEVVEPPHLFHESC